jgi:hypothetical protein
MAIGRRTFIRGLGGAVALAPRLQFALQAAPSAKVDPKFMVTAKEVHAWHAIKDSKGGPTMTGSRSWHNYMELLEKEFRAMGGVDVFRNSWKFQRWSTTEYPNDSNWWLYVDDKKVKVASYGCNSGWTPAAGLQGPLVVYKEGMEPEELTGKIAIVEKARGGGRKQRQRRLRVPFESRDVSRSVEAAKRRRPVESVPDHGAGLCAGSVDQRRRNRRADRDASVVRGVGRGLHVRRSGVA